MELVKRFVVEEEGNDAIEYALIAFLIAVTIIATVGPVGDAINAVFAQVAAALA